VSGTRSQYEPVLITENLSLPVDIAISYKSDLVSTAEIVTLGYKNGDFESEFNGRWFSKVSCVASGRIISLKSHLTGSGSGVINHGRFAVYSDLNGAPHNLLALSDVFDIASDFEGIMSASLVADVVAGNVYWFALEGDVIADNSAWNYFKAGVAGDSVQEYLTDLYTWNNDPVVHSSTWKVEIFAEYLSPPSFARFFIIVYSNYQGRTIENLCEIPFSLSQNWVRLTASLSGVIGVFRGYTAFIEISNARGSLWFDNVDIIHGGINWARDPFCNSIQTTFTKMFYQIPKNWAPEEIISGAFYGSVYEE